MLVLGVGYNRVCRVCGKYSVQRYYAVFLGASASLRDNEFRFLFFALAVFLYDFAVGRGHCGIVPLGFVLVQS
jgi:hypothetical protein